MWPSVSFLRPRVVDRAEVARFRRDGFVVVDRPVVPAGALRVVRDLLDGLFRRADELPEPWVHDLAPGSEEGSVPEIVKTAHVEPRLLKTRAYRVALRAARRLVDGPVNLAFDHAIFKPARSGGVTALHQDLAFDPTWDVPTATIWLALVDTNDHNGCIRFVRAPEQLLDHEALGRDALAAVGFDLAQAQACPVPAGGFTAHNQRALHGSGRNQSREVRAVWILKFTLDDRRWWRRIRDRLLELRGNVVPRRLNETQAAFEKRDNLQSRYPEWVGTLTAAGQNQGNDQLPSGDDLA